MARKKRGRRTRAATEPPAAMIIVLFPLVWTLPVQYRRVLSAALPLRVLVPRAKDVESAGVGRGASVAIQRGQALRVVDVDAVFPPLPFVSHPYALASVSPRSISLPSGIAPSLHPCLLLLASHAHQQRQHPCGCSGRYSDNISMGHSGMSYSLPSRDLIAGEFFLL